MGVAPGPKSETARMKVRFKYRQEHQHYRHLHHPVFDSGYTQWPLAPVRFGYPDPPHRQGPVSLGLEFPLQRVQPLALFFRTARDAFDGLSIHTRTAPVSRDSLERVLQYVPAHDVPVETPEPILRFGFGFAIERALELPNLLGRYYSCSRRTITLSFAPRLRLRTSRVPSPRFEPGQMFGADVPRLIFPAHDSATTNSSDCGTDTRRLAGRTSLCGGVGLGFVAYSSAPLPPLYLWLTFPTCLPRRPRRRLRGLTVIRRADIGLRHHTSDSATPVLVYYGAH